MADHYDEKLLIGYVEDDLDEADRAKVQAWAKADPRLEQLLRHMAEDRAALRGVEAPAPPRWIMDEVDRRLERTMLLDEADPAAPAGQPRPPRVAGRIGIAVGVAAMVLLAAGIIFVSLYDLEGPPIAFSPAQQEPNGTGPVALNDSADPLSDAPQPESASTPQPAPDPGPEDTADRAIADDSPSDARDSAAATAPEAERAMPRPQLAEKRQTPDPSAVSMDAAADRLAARDAEADLAKRPEAQAPPQHTATPREATRDRDDADAQKSAEVDDADTGEVDAALTQEAEPLRENQQLVIRVRTRDLDRTIERLNFATSQIGPARLRSAPGAGPGQAQVQTKEPAELDQPAEADATFAGLDEATTGMASADEAPASEAVTPGEAADKPRESRTETDGPDRALTGRSVDDAAPNQVEQAEKTARRTEGEKPSAAAAATATAVADQADLEADEPGEPRASTDAGEAGDASRPAPSSRQTVRFELEVPADQVETIVQLLNADPVNALADEGGRYQQALVTRVPAETRRLDRAEGPAAAPRRNWPSDRPDYGGIVREQLRIAGGPTPARRKEAAEAATEAVDREAAPAAEPGALTAVGLVVPVIIEYDDDLPAMTPDAVGGEAARLEVEPPADADDEARPTEEDAAADEAPVPAEQTDAPAETSASD